MDLITRSVPQEVMPSVFGCVGMIIVSWTFVENSLDAWSAIAYHDHGGSSIEPELPKQFSRKSTFLKKCFRRLPTLSQLSSESISLIERANDLSYIRHYVAHGTLSSFDPSDESFKFIKIDMTADKKQHKMGELHILGADLIKAGEDLVEMAREGQEITQRLLNTAVP